MTLLQSRLQALRQSMTRQRMNRLFGLLGLVAAALLFILAGTLLVGWDALTTQIDLFNLQVGEVAPETIRSPISISYESEVLTEQARLVAAGSVPDVYDPPDTSLARQQVSLARRILDYIANVRADDNATNDQLVQDLLAITALHLNTDEAQAILDVSAARWTEIDQQVVSVLETVMRSEIREDNIRTIKRGLPSRVSVTRFVEDEVVIITAIVEDLVVVNTFYNEERTLQARQEAAEAITPETVRLTAGQIIVQEGNIVEEDDMEALIKLGVLSPEDRRPQQLMSDFLLMVLVTMLFSLFLSRFHPDVFYDIPRMTVLAVLFLLFLLAMRIVGPQHVLRPYLFPVAAFGLLVATLVGPQAGMLGVVVLALLLSSMAGGMLPLLVILALSGVLGVLFLRHAERFSSYFAAGTLVGLSNTAGVIAFFLNGTPDNPRGALELIGAGWVNGFMTALVAIGGLYLLGSLLNYSTSIRLVELSLPNHPLLQRLLREAPGTYQHSLQVANLAELAAQRIGVQATLTRVGALYHDVGKMHAPHFFVENQADGVNPHDKLNDPYKSAQILIDHVRIGKKMARKYRLPARLHDFIMEHHGTTRPYFYFLALERAGGDTSKVNAADYTYPGPRPQSRETAILMLADSSEAAVRAVRPKSRHEIAEVVGGIFDARMKDSQLDDSGLTLHDLHVIRESFIETLQGVFHPRIAYPGEEGEAPEITEMSDESAEEALAETLAAVMAAPDQETAQVAAMVQTTDLGLFFHDALADEDSARRTPARQGRAANNHQARAATVEAPDESGEPEQAAEDSETTPS